MQIGGHRGLAHERSLSQLGRAPSFIRDHARRRCCASLAGQRARKAGLIINSEPLCTPPPPATRGLSLGGCEPSAYKAPRTPPGGTRAHEATGRCSHRPAPNALFRTASHPPLGLSAVAAADGALPLLLASVASNGHSLTLTLCLANSRSVSLSQRRRRLVALRCGWSRS